MESSDDSFAWTNTSNDNTDMSGDESESGKNYKKKLQKQLFHEQQQTDNTSKKSKKRKLSENNQTEDEVTSAKKPHIKLENCSDQEVKKRKKKSKNNESETSQMILDDEESYHDVKVKRELDNSTSPRKSKKKKHKRRNSNESIKPDQQEPSSEQSNVLHLPERLSNGDDLQNDDNNASNSKVKRKKTRSPKTSVSGFEYNGIHIVDKFESEETLVEGRHSPKVARSHEQDTSFQKNKKRISENGKDVLYNQSKEDNDLDGSQIEGRTPSKKVKPPSEPSARKLSGRLIFEDDLDESSIPIENQVESQVTLSSNLQKYMKVNSNLTPAHSSLLNNTIITDNDELWVLKLPANLNIKELVDTNINIDSKCKFKVDGEAYDGVKMDDTSFIAIASVDDDQQLKIKTYSVTENILVRKRIPKSYISNDILVQNENSFIPLPDTKCRHPLFGSNFKKAMKIPSAIREKLRAAPVEEVSTKERKKKKKLKRERTKSIVLEDEPPASKKRRVWDSEKAIEENLFNF